MKRTFSLLLICLGIAGYAQTPSTNNSNGEKVAKANFRVQIFEKPDSTKVKLIKPDPEFEKRLPISAKIEDPLAVSMEDLPRAVVIDSIWKAELTNADLFEKMQKEIHEFEYSEVALKELPTDTLKARLARLNARTPFDVQYNPILESVIKSYLKRNKKSMERLMALSEYYFPMFEQQLDRYDIPLEIKYLAIVESALNPRAKSRMGATGLWQFMFPTGKMHGLDVSSYVDERMDPLKATEAAAQYLASLYKTFGDWDLVLASYNSGPGNVSKAIRRSGGSTDYWELRKYLPRETAGYVPAFLATLYLFEYADEHKFQPNKPDIAFFETDTIHIKEMLTFDHISEITGVEKEMLQFLNPSFKLDIIPKISKESYALRLPRQHVGSFVNNEEAIYQYVQEEIETKEKDLPAYVETEDKIRYKVKRGDFLGKIAQRYGVGVSSIKRWNNLKNNNLREGQYLVIHPRKSSDIASVSSSSTKNNSSAKQYTVKSGDSLWSISKKFPGVTVQNLRVWNDINTNNLKPGMVLKLSQG